MATLNKVMLIGRLTKDPEETRTLPTGSRVIKFSFAVGRSRKNPSTGQWENDPNPMFLDCEAFHSPNNKRDLVSLIEQYARKGDQMYLEGRLQFDQWDDKQTGQKRSKHKLVVESIEFLSGKNAEGGGGGGGAGRPAGNAGGKPAGRPTAPPDDGDEYGGSSGGGGTGTGGGSGPDGDPIPF